jgi:hypothetical protein
LIAIVLANLSVAKFGPSATIINAFIFIGLDLTCRDSLHEAWHGKGLWWKMLLLILTGGVVSALFNIGALRIAIASVVAFLLAGFFDTVIYTVLWKRKKIIKMNGSNVIASAVDSLAFPVIAFGGFSFVIFAGQFFAKIVGGFLWSLLLAKDK